MLKGKLSTTARDTPNVRESLRSISRIPSYEGVVRSSFSNGTGRKRKNSESYMKVLHEQAPQSVRALDERVDDDDSLENGSRYDISPSPATSVN